MVHVAPRRATRVRVCRTWREYIPIPEAVTSGARSEQKAGFPSSPGLSGPGWSRWQLRGGASADGAGSCGNADLWPAGDVCSSTIVVESFAYEDGRAWPIDAGTDDSPQGPTLWCAHMDQKRQRWV